MEDPSHSGIPRRNESNAMDARKQTVVSRDLPDASNFETMSASGAAASNPPPHMSSATLVVLARRYDILAEAGRGAMGHVYKARDRETNEIVALKLLKPEIASDQAMIDRFKSELLFARRITHKNVCRVYEFNRVEGIAYTSMEFVEGESLRSVLKRFGSVTQRKGIDLALQMCSGLKEAHAQGIVHRDLKPENVMIDAHGNVKIMDFGIARSMEALTLVTGAMIGTPAYMAPEQAAGKQVDHRADIYAVGLMLYEMFTGVQPFRGDNAITIALKHINEAPAPPREIEPSISSAIEQAVLHCLEKDPDNRFQSMADLESVLQRSSVSATLVTDASAPATAINASQAATTATAAAPSAGGWVAPPFSPSPVEPKADHLHWARTLLLIALILLGTRVIWRHIVPAAPPEKVSSDENFNLNVPGASISVAPTSVSIVKSDPTIPPASVLGQPAKPATSSTNAAGALPVAASHSETPTTPARTTSPVHVRVSPAPVDPTPPAAPTTPPPQQVVSPTNTFSYPLLPLPKGGGYIWVSRFPREAGAQNAAKRIGLMGLPVAIIPHHKALNDSDFFVVLAGPITAEKIDGIITRLKANGFSLAHQNRPAASANRAASSLTSAP
jgi:serine/threonine protein kinase